MQELVVLEKLSEHNLDEIMQMDSRDALRRIHLNILNRVLLINSIIVKKEPDFKNEIDNQEFLKSIKNLERIKAIDRRFHRQLVNFHAERNSILISIEGHSTNLLFYYESIRIIKRLDAVIFNLIN